MNYITRLPKNKVSSIKRNIFFQKKAGLAARVWRRVRDSNPRCWRTPVCSPLRAALRGPLQSRRFCGSAVRHRAAGRRDLPSAASAAQDGGSSRNGATIVHFIGVPAGPTVGAEPCSPVNPFFLDGKFGRALSLVSWNREIQSLRPLRGHLPLHKGGFGWAVHRAVWGSRGRIQPSSVALGLNPPSAFSLGPLQRPVLFSREKRMGGWGLSPLGRKKVRPLGAKIS